MGSRALVYYFSTTIFAAIVGICCVLAIHPGDPSIKKNLAIDAENKQVSTVDAVLDLIRNLFPENLVEACIRYQATSYDLKADSGVKVLTPGENATTAAPIKVRKMVYKDGMNVLGVIGFCIVFGIIIGQ